MLSYRAKDVKDQVDKPRMGTDTVNRHTTGKGIISQSYIWYDIPHEPVRPSSSLPRCRVISSPLIASFIFLFINVSFLSSLLGPLPHSSHKQLYVFLLYDLVGPPETLEKDLEIVPNRPDHTVSTVVFCVSVRFGKDKITHTYFISLNLIIVSIA
jgi:hypothetical protein